MGEYRKPINHILRNKVIDRKTKKREINFN